MAAYLERDDFVYPSNSDDSDFEGTVRSSPDITSEIFDPPPPVPFSSDSETEIVEENENNPNANEPNSYGLQETPMYNYSGDHENEESHRIILWKVRGCVTPHPIQTKYSLCLTHKV